MRSNIMAAIPPLPPAPDPNNGVPSLAIDVDRIREELDRNQKYLEFAQNQIGKDREFYRHLITAAGVLFVIFGYFTYQNTKDMRSDIKNSANATLAAVQIGVQNRINTEFQSENIAALIRSVTKERVDKQAAGIIHAEVASALQEKTAQLQTAYQNVNRLLNEYERKSEEINSRLQALGAWELRPSEKDKLTSGLQRLKPGAIIFITYENAESMHFADSFAAPFRERQWSTLRNSAHRNTSNDPGVTCFWKEGNPNAESLSALIKRSVGLVPNFETNS
uniref:Uncharacterized protein n=1 Tax=Solibacter usitatus (strain Ellin6076) TaxID=234267 RepID=Q01RH9_SOLUE